MPNKKTPAPVISVIIPTYNGARFIAQTVESVLTQTVGELEIIIVDDNSDEQTKKVLAEIIKNTKRVLVIPSSPDGLNVGPGPSRNLGVQTAKAPLIALIDDDDLWLAKDKLELQITYLNTHPECVLVGTADNDIIDETGKLLIHYHNPVTDSEIRHTALLRNPFINSSVVFRKETFSHVGGFKDMRLAEDYDLWLRMAKFGRVANIQHNLNPQPLTAYRRRPSSVSSQKKKAMAGAILAIVKRYRKDFPLSLLGLAKAYVRLFVIHFQ
ncbi:MAG: glycosyltransferase [Candidatus Pacebacteria bacterium]|nr:glycosyltransferase [Candidatus Paceibacterota bacterium]